MSKKYIHNNEANSYGGGDIIIDVLRKRGIPEFINSYLGERHPRAEYSYSEGIFHYFIAQCRGAKRIENMYDCRDDLKNHPNFGKGMSPDTYLYMCKELARPNKYYKKENISEKLAKKIEKGKAFDSHEVNTIEKYNEWLVDTLILLGFLKVGGRYILDYDTTDIETKHKHSRRYYKGNGKKAYCPAVAMINKMPVYIENRNGDSNASFKLTQTIDSILNLLSKKGIIVDVIRIDAAGFSKEFTEFVNAKGLKYVTRAKYTTVKNEKEFIRNWTETTIKKCTNEIGDNVFHFGKDETRMIVKKVIEKDGAVRYWGLITNEFDKSNAEIINLYAQRGDCENLFSALNEFSWDVLPMRKFEHNTVYLYLTAFNYILYKFITNLFESKTPRVWQNMELKTFIDKFMAVPTMWIKNKLRFLKRAREYMILLEFT